MFSGDHCGAIHLFDFLLLLTIGWAKELLFHWRYVGVSMDMATIQSTARHGVPVSCFALPTQRQI
jgi:hypothetical protein